MCMFCLIVLTIVNQCVQVYTVKKRVGKKDEGDLYTLLSTGEDLLAH